VTRRGCGQDGRGNQQGEGRNGREHTLMLVRLKPACSGCTSDRTKQSTKVQRAKSKWKGRKERAKSISRWKT